MASGLFTAGPVLCGPTPLCSMGQNSAWCFSSECHHLLYVLGLLLPQGWLWSDTGFPLSLLSLQINKQALLIQCSSKSMREEKEKQKKSCNIVAELRIVVTVSTSKRLSQKKVKWSSYCSFTNTYTYILSHSHPYIDIYTLCFSKHLKGESKNSK